MVRDSLFLIRIKVVPILVEIRTFFFSERLRRDFLSDNVSENTSSLCQKIFRKNGCSIDSFETEWRNGLTSNGTEDCAVLAVEEIKLLARKKEIEEKEYTKHEMKNFRLKHILDMENINKD